MKEWLYEVFMAPTSATQAIIVLSVIIAIGGKLGKIKCFGISLGVTFVFFIGILLGHLGLSIDPQMLRYAQDFGLVIFVYELGLQVGPGFFSSFKQEGLRLNLLALSAIAIGVAMVIGMSFLPGQDIISMTGVLCGATTCTPGMSAARQATLLMGHDATNVPLGWAVAYPLGVVGVILAMIVLRKWVAHPNAPTSETSGKDQDATYIATFKVTNPGIIGQNLQVLAEKSGLHFNITRLWRKGVLTVPRPDMAFHRDDRVLTVLERKDHDTLRMLFGTEEKDNWNDESIDWNSIDHNLVSRILTVTNAELNGKRLSQLKLRNRYRINVSRIIRSGVKLLATPELVLQMGDRLIVVGEAQAVKDVEKVFGNSMKILQEPNLISTCIGIILGLLLGSVPISLPGLSQPIRLGLAGGPIVMGILLGRFGPQLRLITYTTESANLMLRSLGIELYLACLGLSTGARFFETVMCPEGAMWVGMGFLVTIVPILIIGTYAYKVKHYSLGSTYGLMAGSSLNPFALEYAGDTVSGDAHSVSYATVYPLCMFTRVIVAQLLIMIFV